MKLVGGCRYCALCHLIDVAAVAKCSNFFPRFISITDALLTRSQTSSSQKGSFLCDLFHSVSLFSFPLKVFACPLILKSVRTCLPNKNCLRKDYGKINFIILLFSCSSFHFVIKVQLCKWKHVGKVWLWWIKQERSPAYHQVTFFRFLILSALNRILPFACGQTFLLLTTTHQLLANRFVCVCKSGGECNLTWYNDATMCLLCFKRQLPPKGHQRVRK